MSGGECYKCGKPGHFARDCHNGAGGGMGRGDFRNGRGGMDTCYKCNKPGHFARECRVDQDRCYKCNQPGHIAKECDKEIDSGACYNCKSPGHLRRDCPELGNRPCYRCGKNGHLARDCPEDHGPDDRKSYGCGGRSRWGGGRDRGGRGDHGSHSGSHSRDHGISGSSGRGSGSSAFSSRGGHSASGTDRSGGRDQFGRDKPNIYNQQQPMNSFSQGSSKSNNFSQPGVQRATTTTGAAASNSFSTGFQNNSVKSLLGTPGDFQGGNLNRGSFQPQQGGFNQKPGMSSQQSSSYSNGQSMYGQQQQQQQSWGQQFRPPLPLGNPPTQTQQRY